MFTLFTNNVIFSNLDEQVLTYTRRLIELNKILLKQFFLSKSCFYLKKLTKIMYDSASSLGWIVYTSTMFFHMEWMVNFYVNVEYFSLFNRYYLKFTFSKLKWFYLKFIKSSFIILNKFFSPLSNNQFTFLSTQYTPLQPFKECDMNRLIFWFKCIFVETLLVPCHGNYFIL